MSQQKTKSPSRESNTAIHPLDFFKPEWTVSEQSIGTENLIVQHSIQPPDEIEHFSLTHHFAILQLSFGTRQISRIGEEKYEGLFDVGEFFIQPAEYSSFYSWGSTDESIVFFLEPEYLSDIAAQTECLNPSKIELNPLAIARDPTIEYIARSFLTEMQNEALGGRLYSEILATQFAIHLLRNYCTFPAQLKQYEKGLSRPQLQTVINYIDANLEFNISLQQLASLCQLSSHYFCHLFKKSTGIAPYQYVLQQRVAKAKQLLKQQDLPMVEIALMCGFSSQSAFSRTFSKCVGTTPSKYRQE